MSIYTLYKDVYKLLYMIISFWIHFKSFKDEKIYIEDKLECFRNIDYFIFIEIEIQSKLLHMLS
jgi:hypothetical protein